MSGPRRLTRRQARRILLRSQGFGCARGSAPVGRRQLSTTVSKLGFFQIDSVNVLQRAHLVPLFSRLGPYDESVFTRAAERRPRAMFEYWTHMAAYTDVALWPALQHRMETSEGMWGSIRRVADEHPRLLGRVHDLVAEKGPLTAREVAGALESLPLEEDESTGWSWNWSATKTALENLFHRGVLTSAHRTSAFERVYDLPERVLPADVLALPPLDGPSAHLRLVEHAAKALGVATDNCLRDYFRTEVEPTRTAIGELARIGVLEPVEIDGWNRRAWLHVEAPTPRPIGARTLLSPFDPVVFERTRARQLFDFDYRIEIYVPEAQRVHGYYVLPFLLGDELVARVDLKADRRARRLLVQSAHAEPDAPADTAEQLLLALWEVAEWLGLDEVEVRDRGDLAPRIRAVQGD